MKNVSSFPFWMIVLATLAQLAGSRVQAAPLQVSTYAGSVDGSTDGFRKEARFQFPAALAFGPNGSIFVTEANIPTFTTTGEGAHRIRRIDPAGVVSTFAGSREAGLVDGPRLNARFRGPNAIVFDRSGSMFLSDRLNHRIRKIDPGGMVSTFAGSTAGHRDAVGLNAQFNSPIGLCIDQNDNLYVADFENLVIRKVTPSAEVTTYAGIPGFRGSQNGHRTSATFNSPHWVARSVSGDLFVADWLNGQVRKISADGMVSTFASGLEYIEVVAIDPEGGIYASIPPGGGAHRFVKFDPAGQIEWSLENLAGFKDGPVALAQFNHYSQPLFMPNGNILMADAPRIRLIELDQPCISAPDDLVSWWSAEGKAEDVAGNQHASLGGGVRFSPGKVGLGFHFNGIDGRATVADAPALNFGPDEPLSIEAWIKVDADSRKHGISIVDKRFAPSSLNGIPFNAAVGYSLYLSDGRLGVQLADPPLENYRFHDFISRGPDLRDGEFHHVAVSINRNEPGGGRLYADGEVVLTFDPTSVRGDLSNSEPFLIGNHASEGYDGFFPGIIDELSLYRRALSDEEVKSLYQAGAGKCSPPKITARRHDFRSDWSDASNPNGPWTFLAGNVVLPQVGDWKLDVFDPPQGGWAFGSTIPFWFRGSSGPPPGEDWQQGDVVVHTHRAGGINGEGNGVANVTWTSPARGTIDISGGLWEARDIADLGGGLRGNRWNLFVREALLSSGTIQGGDPHSRANPFPLALGSGGPSALEDIVVFAGDVVRLEFVPTGVEGDYVGVNFTITHLSESQPGSVAFLSNLAGSGVAGYQDGAGRAATFHSPNGGFVGPDHASYIADTFNHVIRRIELQNAHVATVAGIGIPGDKDGPAATAQFNQPLGVFADRFGSVFVADTGNNRVRKISAENSRQVSTYAGHGQRGYIDGPAALAQFDFPNDVAGDSAGNIYVSEFNNHTIRKIAPDGTVSTFIGNGVPGFADDIGIKAGLNQPAGLAIDKHDNLYITEWGSHRIRKATTAGVVSTLAGSVFPGLVDGEGVSARFYRPDGIAVDPVGALFVTENGNHTVRRISLGGTVTTIAGTGLPGYVEGTARSAQFTGPGGIGIAASGSLIIADTGNHRVRTITFLTSPEFVRSLPIYYAPEATMSVRLEMSAPPHGSLHVYAVEESPPVNWVVSNISAEGVYDRATHKVKFGPFFDLEHRVLTYDVTPLPTESGPKLFEGITTADGSELEITGSKQVLPPPLHPADSNPADQRISVNELTAYSAGWRKGEPWKIAPNPIPVDYVTRAGLLWRNGEAYRFDPNIDRAPLWWVNRPAIQAASVADPGNVRASRNTSSATRILPVAFVPGEPFVIRVAVEPAVGVSAYAIEDHLPLGLVLHEVSDNGEFNAANRTLRWGPFFDDKKRELRTQVSFDGTTNTVSLFLGVASFDGMSIAIQGPEIVRAAIRLTLPRFSNGEFNVRAMGSDGETYFIQTSSDLKIWATLGAVTNQGGALHIADPEAIRSPMKFYRALSREP